MTTVQDDPSASEQTPEQDTSAGTTETTSEGTTVEELKKKLAAQEEATKKAENEASRWKGRVEKINKASKDEEKEEKVDEEDPKFKELEWKLENKDRIEAVKEDYEKFLEEGYEGEPVTKKIALELAEKVNKVDSVAERERQATMSSTSVTNRDTGEPELTDYDQRMGVNPETKKKHAAYVEGKR